MPAARSGFGLWAASSPYEAWLSAYVTGQTLMVNGGRVFY